jgi:hypothetical protein
MKLPRRQFVALVAFDPRSRQLMRRRLGEGHEITVEVAGGEGLLIAGTH